MWRHPFPGPGLAIRIIGEVNRERAQILRDADSIFIEEIKASGDYPKIGQVDIFWISSFLNMLMSSSFLYTVVLCIYFLIYTFLYILCQAFVVLLPDCKTVGVMGDQRTYGMVRSNSTVETS